VNVDTGKGFVNGHLLINDAVAAIGVDAGTARNDALVMLENNTNAALTAGAGSNYNTVGNADIPPYSARLAVVKDVAANFSQTNALYMVQLATFTTGAGALTSFTDVRDWCDFATNVTPAMIANRTRRFFVPVSYAYNESDVALAAHRAQYGWELTDNKTVSCYGHFIVPDDFSSGMTVQAAVRAAGSGNIYVQNHINYGACAENFIIHTTALGYAAAAVTITLNNCICSTAMANASTGDIANIIFTRAAADASDTLDTWAGMPGWVVTYTADS
jgi:hypothetical protein